MEFVDSSLAANALIKILIYTGHWQRDKNDSAHRFQKLERYYRYLLHVPLTFTYVTLMWAEAIITITALDGGTDVIYMAFTEAAMVVKILSFWYFNARARQYMHQIDTLTKYALGTKKERTFWQSRQLAFRRIAFGYIGVSVASFLTACLGSLLSGSSELIFGYWVPFEWRHRRNYWYAFAYECLALPLTCISNTTLDMIFCYFLFHLALLYRVIGMRLEALHHVLGDNAAKELRHIIILHQQVKRLTLHCQSIVSTPIFFQIIFSSFILCFSAYRMQQINIAENPRKFFALLQFISSVTLQIYLPCYYANEITVNSDLLITCAYDSDWPQFPIATRKLMYRYMESLKSQVAIKAGNFFEVGLPIFLKTVNNAYSIFALLTNMAK